MFFCKAQLSGRLGEPRQLARAFPSAKKDLSLLKQPPSSSQARSEPSAPQLQSNLAQWMSLPLFSAYAVPKWHGRSAFGPLIWGRPARYETVLVPKLCLDIHTNLGPSLPRGAYRHAISHAADCAMEDSASAALDATMLDHHQPQAFPLNLTRDCVWPSSPILSMRANSGIVSASGCLQRQAQLRLLSTRQLAINDMPQQP